MATLTLYFNPFSQPSNAVRLLIYANDKQALFDFKPLTLEQMKSADYLRINPNGQVPALVDGEVVVLESAAIMEYLVTKLQLPTHWYPTDLVRRARVSEYLHWHHTHLRKGAGAFFKAFFVEGDHDVDAELEHVENGLKHIEKHFLRDSSFIGGEEISVADLQALSELIQLNCGRLLLDLFDFPKVGKIMHAVYALPGFSVVFEDLEKFSASLPTVKSKQLTIKGDREMLKNLKKARPAKQRK